MTLHIQYTDPAEQFITETFTEEVEREFFLGRRKDDEFTPRVNITWDDSISRPVHARIAYMYGTWYIEHLADRNQTKLNGEVLPWGIPHELPPESEVILGRKTLTITHDEFDIIPDGVITSSMSLTDPTPDVSETQRFNVFAEIAQVLATDGSDQLARLLAVIRSLFPSMHAGGIALYRDKEIVNPAYYPPSRAEISDKLARRALATRLAFRWDRRVAVGESQHYSSLTGTTQALYAPILRGARTLGVLYLHTHNAFSDEDLSLLKAISEIIGANAHFDPATADLRLPSVFISYSHQDTDFVCKLVKDMRRQRVTVWFDERLRGGQDWQDQLAQAIEQSDAFALVMSPNSLQSKWVRWEIEKAQALGKRVFPLWHQVCDDVSEELARLQRINLLADYQTGVLELVEELYLLSGEEDTLKSEPVVMRSAQTREKIRILFLAANPRDTDPLRLGEEIRTIQERIRGGRFRDQFDTIQQAWAVRFSDLQQYLLEYRPHIVHFSGHGGTDGALMMEDNAGNTQPVNKQALGLLFNALNSSDDANSVRLVVMNACFSAVQAKAIVQEVGCVLGMTRAVSDPAAIEFAGAFYNALTFGPNVQTAFNLATAAMALIGEEETPRLLTEGINANEIVFCREDGA